MPFSDYSQRMAQNQVDLVLRFDRVVTQRIGALDDAYLSRGRSLGLSRLLWEIEPAGSEVRLLRARLGLDSAITLPMYGRHRTYTPNLSKRGAIGIVDCWRSSRPSFGQRRAFHRRFPIRKRMRIRSSRSSNRPCRRRGQTVIDPYKKGLVALYESYLSLGKVLYAEGRYEDASGAFLKAARILPDQPALLESWGLDLIALGRYEEAEALLQRAKDLLRESGKDRNLSPTVGQIFESWSRSPNVCLRLKQS
jgi:tetratricopeptide (TPR) repeat protein